MSPFAKILKESGKKVALKLSADLPEIGGGALRECEGLISADLSECTNITSIEDGAFASCTGLTEIMLPATVKKISDAVFSKCSGLTKIKLPKELTEIGKFAFYLCTNLKNLDLSDCTALTKIKPAAFKDCPIEILSINCDVKSNIITNLIKEPKVKENLKNLTLGTGVKTIGNDAFAGCEKLEAADLSACAKLTGIGKNAFLACKELKTPDFSACTELTKIDDVAFQNCNELTGVDLSGCTKLTLIGERAFFECTKAQVKQPKSIRDIGAGAFGLPDEATYLCEKVLIPASNFDAIKRKVTDSEYPEDRIEQYQD